MVKHTELQVQASFLSGSGGLLHPSSHPWWVSCAPGKPEPAHRLRDRAQGSLCPAPPAPRPRSGGTCFPSAKWGGDGTGRIRKVCPTAPSNSEWNLKSPGKQLHLPLSLSGRRRGRTAAGPPARAPRRERRPDFQPPSCRRTRLTRPPLSAPGTLVPGRPGDAVGGGAGGGRARKWGRGGAAARASRDGGARRRALGGDTPPRGSRRGARPPRGRWRRKKVTARGAALRLAPQVAGKRGRGARGRGAGRFPGERSEWPQVLWAEVALKVGNRVGTAEAVGGVAESAGCEQIILGF